MDICEKDMCLACYCCENICPVDSITMKLDEYGQIYPYVDENKCIKCNKCKNSCPQNTEPQFRQPLDIYASYSVDKNDRATSASGGMASVFYDKIISEKGVAFGAKFENKLEVNIVPAETKEQLKEFKGSKYVQAAAGSSYKRVKEYLKSNKKVLYVGTPCQIDGLLNFLGKYANNDNLLTVDLICHGTPSIKYLQEYAYSIDKSSDKASFRGADNFVMQLYSGDKQVYSRPSNKDLYFTGFLSSLYYKKACYQCQYAQEKRVSDITIGDFWGLGITKPFSEDAYKVSLALVNTEKGKRFFESCSSKLFVEKRDYAEAKEFNPQLNYPSKKHKDTDVFFEQYKNVGFLEAVKATSIPQEIKEAVKQAKIDKIKYYKKRIFEKVFKKGE